MQQNKSDYEILEKCWMNGKAPIVTLLRERTIEAHANAKDALESIKEHEAGLSDDDLWQYSYHAVKDGRLVYRWELRELADHELIMTETTKSNTPIGYPTLSS